jgi:hypothetical protein
VILDPSAIAKLHQLAERVKVCDPSGRVLGYFTPLTERSLIEGAEILAISETALAQAEKEIASGKTHTTAEVLAYLESLERA